MLDFIKTMTPIQKIGTLIGAGSFVAASTSQLDVLFGPPVEHLIVAALTITTGILGVVLTNIGGSASVAKYVDQGTMLKSVQAMPGVESITLNSRASPAAATLAMDPAQDKIEATPQAATAVAATAATAAVDKATAAAAA